MFVPSAKVNCSLPLLRRTQENTTRGVNAPQFVGEFCLREKIVSASQIYLSILYSNTKLSNPLWDPLPQSICKVYMYMGEELIPFAL